MNEELLHDFALIDEILNGNYLKLQYVQAIFIIMLRAPPCNLLDILKNRIIDPA